MKTKKEPKSRFRYLEKYVGKYRVKARYDLDTLDFPKDEQGSIDSTFEDLYIPCSKGIILHTYEDEELSIFFEDRLGTCRNVVKEIKNKYPAIHIRVDECGADAYIYFYASDLPKVAKIVLPRTSGAAIKPFSNKNLPKSVYEIPEEDLKEIYTLTDNLSKVDKMQFFRKINSEFLDSIKTVNGKRINGKVAQKESRLPPKEFIHSVGLWDKYINYIKEKV